jgi:SynChlorMet cassette radical SAM/SPASM protein ScmF
VTGTPDRSNGFPQLQRLYVYLAEGCNLACRHCWISPPLEGKESRGAFLPADILGTAVREGLPLGLTNVKLTGGEPLLHPGFVQILDILKKAGVRLTVETNGVLMTPALAAAISGFPERMVSVSLDGADASTHDAVRGSRGAFDGACRAVRLLSEAGTPPQVIFSVMRSNADQAEAVVRLAERMGASSVKFNIVQPTARGERLHEADETLSIGELLALGRYVDGELAGTTKRKLYFDYPWAFRPLSRIGKGEVSGRCGILNVLGLIASGDYALCGIGEHVPELVFGKAGRDNLAELWEGHPMLNALREGMPSRMEGVCGSCLMKGMCLGSCVAQNYYRSRNLFAPFWFCEAAETQGLFPESRRASV